MNKFKVMKLAVVILVIIATLNMMGNLKTYSSFGVSATDFIAANGLILLAGFRWLGYLVLLSLAYLGVRVWENKSVTKVSVIDKSKESETV